MWHLIYRKQGRIDRADLRTSITGMNDFPQATLEMWQARVAAILKGESAEKLVSRTADGIRIEPLYQQIKGLHGRSGRIMRHGLLCSGWIIPMARRPMPRRWMIWKMARADFAIVNKDADVARVLQDVALHAIHTRLEGGDGLAKAFAAYVGKQPIDPARLSVSFRVE